MDFFKGKTVVVTGASSGIGRALAEYFAAAGANAVLGARHEDALREIVGRIGAAGGHAAYAVCDVTREADCKRLIDTAVDTFGGVDVLICNAGISMRALFDEVDLAVLHKLMDVNFWGCVNCTKYALPYIQKARRFDRGRVVGCRDSRAAGPYRLLGFEVCDDGLFGDDPYRESQEGRARDDRLSGLYGFERALFGTYGRRLAAGRDAPRGGQDDDGRRGGPYHRPCGRAAQALVPDGISGDVPRISSRNSGRRCSTGSSIGICPRSPIRLSSSALSASAGSYRPAATRCGCGRALFLFGIGQNPSLYENKCLCSGQPPCQILVGVVDCRSAFDPGRRTLSGDARRDARRTVDAVYRRAARRRNYGYRAGRLQQRYAARLGLDARDGNHGTFAGDHADGHAPSGRSWGR